jgi:hypothetical protein
VLRDDNASIKRPVCSQVAATEGSQPKISLRVTRSCLNCDTVFAVVSIPRLHALVSGCSGLERGVLIGHGPFMDDAVLRDAEEFCAVQAKGELQYLARSGR